MPDAPEVSDAVRISLTQGREALIDAADAPLVADRKWYVTIKADMGHAYAVARSGKGKTPISMHRMLMNAPKGMVVDHINGDGLDNRRSNLRLATHRENIRNQRLRFKQKTSRFKGVSYHAENNKWQAEIEQNGGRLCLGLFEDEERAARCYDAAAKVFHGRFACTNRSMGLLA